MYLTSFLLSGALSCALTACTAPSIQAVWPPPSPLGQILPAYQPPIEPPGTALAAREVAEPASVLQLRQAQALALMQNPTLAAFGWEVRAGEARTLQAGLLPNPEVHVEIENVAGSGEFRGFEGTEITLGLSQMIELAGKRSKRVRVAAWERDLAAWEYETARVDVLTQVAQAFVEVLSAQARLAVDEDLMRLADQVLAVVAERVRAGKVSPVEESKARVASSTRRIALAHAQRDLAAARAHLATLWGSTTPSFERAEGSLDAITAIPSLEQLTQRIGQNPDIARWVTVIAQRQAAVHLAEAQRIPDPTLGGGFRYSNETNDNALVMEVALPLPVFDRHQGKILETRYQLAKAAEERRLVQVQVSAALQEAYATLSAAFVEAIALQNEVVPGAQRAFDAASEGFRQGKFSFLEVLDAQRTLFESRVQYIEALATYHKAVADVERLIGEPLATVTPATPQP